MKKRALFAMLLGISLATTAQGPNILFIGNSYTEVNNLPGMLQSVAQSMGDNLTYASNTPGGCTFSQHCSNRSMDLICAGGWDVVVLQEQSQYPSFPQSQVENEVFPYAERLIDSIYAHNPCAEPMFYMTWGRKNGDYRNAQYFPILGTYEDMDSMLCERYTFMAETYDASLCPVGRVWRYLRTNHPEIELYQSDESHPSIAGTFAAACAFYTMIFHRDPDSINYNASLDETTAHTIRAATHQVVYENLAQWQRPRPNAEISHNNISSTTIELVLTCDNCNILICNFGDGTDSLLAGTNGQTIYHTYSDTGYYRIELLAQRHCMTDTTILEIRIGEANPEIGINATTTHPITLYPNPTTGDISLYSETATTADIVDENGIIIWHLHLNCGTTTLPTHILPQGSYFICTHARGKSYKLIKN